MTDDEIRKMLEDRAASAGVQITPAHMPRLIAAEREIMDARIGADPDDSGEARDFWLAVTGVPACGQAAPGQPIPENLEPEEPPKPHDPT